MRTGAAGRVWAVVLLAGALAARPAAAQDLADFDYENLSFRGVGVAWGGMWPTRVESAQTVEVRLDLGYLGPGLRIVPTVGYWSSSFQAGEVRELEDRVADLIRVQTGTPPASVDLGTIEWSDVKIGVDGHVVWRIPFDLLTYAGAGGAVHLLNGDGRAINGTFVEDLLDSVTAGFNLHAGVEYPVARRLRLYGQGRYEVLGDLQYFQAMAGLQVMLSGPAPGEERR